MTVKKYWKLLAVGCVALAMLALRLQPAGRTDRRPGPEPAATLTGHRAPVQALSFGPDDATLTSVAYYVSNESTADVTTWDVATGAPTALRTEEVGPLPSFAFDPGGRRLASAQGRSLRLWDAAASGERRLLGELPSLALALAFSADGRQLAVADNANRVSLLDTATGRPTARCKGQAHPAYALAFAPDGTALAGALRDGTIRLWGGAAGERGVLGGHACEVWAVAFSPDSRVLASGDERGVVKLWDVATAAERATLRAREDEVAALAFSPDGGTLAAATGRAVQLWDVGTGKPVACLEGHEATIKALAYSRDGTFLASGSYDKTVRLWRVARAAR